MRLVVGNYLQYGFFLLLLVWLRRPLGAYMHRVFVGEGTPLDRFLKPLERFFYGCAGVDPRHPMSWREYARCWLGFSLVGTLLLYVVERCQQFGPWFYAKFMATPLTADLAMNTALSFSTTTTWQAYAGETTMSYLTQAVGLTAQGFLAGASGLAAGIAFMRGLGPEPRKDLGNFWFDLVRSLLWILLPAAILSSLLLVWQGTPQNFSPYQTCQGLEGGQQVLAQGPVASFSAVMYLGTNGGGYFNPNAAHPYQNPTALANLVLLLSIALIPAALTHTFGLMVGRPSQGASLFRLMLLLFLLGLVVCDVAEQTSLPQLRPQAQGGNLEGKEVRFGVAGSVLTTCVASNTCTGSANAQHDSYTPIGGMVPIVNMMLGEIVFGGLGTGIYSVVLVTLAAVFLAGLMVGRTPEYLGKSIGSDEMKLIALYHLACPLAILLPAAVAVLVPAGLAGLTTNSGAHGLSEILCAYSTCFANNGLAFNGLNGNSPFYNLTTMVAMMLGRFGLGLPALALAQRLARQKQRSECAGTLMTDSWSFTLFVLCTVFLLGALCFFPALALGPLAEYLTSS